MAAIVRALWLIFPPPILFTKPSLLSDLRWKELPWKGKNFLFNSEFSWEFFSKFLNFYFIDVTRGSVHKAKVLSLSLEFFSKALTRGYWSSYNLFAIQLIAGGNLKNGS